MTDDKDARRQGLQDAMAERVGLARGADGGWGYREGARSRLEPTCWALLALLGSGRDVTASVLNGWPARDGLLIDPPTGLVNVASNALALLTLAAFKAGEARVEPILEGLLALRGRTFRSNPAIAQDGTLLGWPWVPDTSSWVEPTAWSLLAVKRTASPDRPTLYRERVESATALLLDRACRGGGWNYGNAQVFGKFLDAQVPPSAVALMALQDRRGDPRVAPSRRWLQAWAVRTRSPLALSLSLMAATLCGDATAAILDALEQELTRLDHDTSLWSASIACFALSGLDHGYAAFRLPHVEA